MEKSILVRLIDAVVEHERNRDMELEFLDNHGHPDYWGVEDVVEHNAILTDIKASHDKVESIIREATGDPKFSL